MSDSHVVSTSTYLLNTHTLLLAGRRLQGLLDADAAHREFAITQLELAAEQQNSGALRYRAFMFTELEAAPVQAAGVPERSMEDSLASVLADVHVANVLIAAGQSLGEAGALPERAHLNEALGRLENTLPVIDRSLAVPLASGQETGRSAFMGEAAAPQPITSKDKADAITVFRHQSTVTLESLIAETRGVAESVIRGLAGLDRDKINAILASLGTSLEEVPKIGRLIRLGMDKLQTIIAALSDLMTNEALQAIKSRIQEFLQKTWQNIKDGTYVKTALDHLLEVQPTEDRIAEILKSDTLEQASLDRASNAIAVLETAFKQNMMVLHGIVIAATLTATLVSPLTGPWAAGAAATIYVLVLAAAVLIAMDYADVGHLLQRISGIRSVAESLLNA